MYHVPHAAACLHVSSVQLSETFYRNLACCPLIGVRLRPAVTSIDIVPSFRCVLGFFDHDSLVERAGQVSRGLQVQFCSIAHQRLQMNDVLLNEREDDECINSTQLPTQTLSITLGKTAVKTLSKTVPHPCTISSTMRVECGHYRSVRLQYCRLTRRPGTFTSR